MKSVRTFGAGNTSRPFAEKNVFEELDAPTP